jgi:hypothetical protein
MARFPSMTINPDGRYPRRRPNTRSALGRMATLFRTRPPVLLEYVDSKLCWIIVYENITNGEVIVSAG